MIRSLFLLLSLLCGLSLSAQREIPPRRDYLVHDYADLLSRTEETELGEKLAAYARETSTQIVVVTEESLEGADPFQRSLDIAESWGIGGSEQKDNGILLYIAEQDRKIQIQTGYGAEGFLPDVTAGRIIRNTIAPLFREGRYYAALDRATTIMMDLGTGEYVAEPGDGSGQGGIPPIVILFLILVVFIVLSGMANRNDDDDDDGGYWRGGRYDMDDPYRGGRRRRGGGWVVFPGGFGGGGGGGGGLGGFGGGGFGGFGGGGFGGGGAGGGW